MSEAEEIIGGGETGNLCVSCLGEPCGVSRMPGIPAFHVCQQCHDNGDFKEWFLEWFKAQFNEATK